VQPSKPIAAAISDLYDAATAVFGGKLSA